MHALPSGSFESQYQLLLEQLVLNGLRPKTIDAYSRAIRPTILCSCCGAVMQIVQTQIKPWLLKRVDIAIDPTSSTLAARGAC